MRIYVASSWRNDYQPRVVEALREANHQVYDFRKPSRVFGGFSWKQTLENALESQREPPWFFETYLKALSHPIAARGYAMDITMLESADACIFVHPAGRSASFELGYAVAKGKKCLVYIPEFEKVEPELMFSDCAFAPSEDAMLTWAYIQHIRIGLDTTAVSPPKNLESVRRVP